MSDEGGAGEPLSDRQKREIALWFLSNAPAGEIHYVAKDVRALLGDDAVYEAAAAEAFPDYNKAHLVSLELPDRSGDIIITTYGELDKNNYLDPRTAQFATVDHIKQVDALVEVIEGEPRYVLCNAAEKHHADLLVVGSHGYGAIKRAFLGSVSDCCAHHTHCSVMIVKRPMSNSKS